MQSNLAAMLQRSLLARKLQQNMHTLLAEATSSIKPYPWRLLAAAQRTWLLQCSMRCHCGVIEKAEPHELL
jgi:hypothetical protein